jgi:hypothetical protein
MAVPVVDARFERPEPPKEFTPAERELWTRIVHSRRPLWFSGSESLLQSYVTLAVHVQKLEAEIRKAVPSAAMSYVKLMQIHARTVAQCASLATKLRLSPSTRIDKNTKHDGEVPLQNEPAPWRLRVAPDVGTGCGERRFSDLLEAQGRGVEVVATASLAASEALDVFVGSATVANGGNDGEEATGPAACGS